MDTLRRDDIIALIKTMPPAEEGATTRWVYDDDDYCVLPVCERCGESSRDAGRYCSHCGREVTGTITIGTPDPLVEWLERVWAQIRRKEKKERAK